MKIEQQYPVNKIASTTDHFLCPIFNAYLLKIY